MNKEIFKDAEFTVYSTEACPKCKVLKAQLEKKGFKYKEINDGVLLSASGITAVPVLGISARLGMKDALGLINAMGDSEDSNE